MIFNHNNRKLIGAKSNNWIIVNMLSWLVTVYLFLGIFVQGVRFHPIIPTADIVMTAFDWWMVRISISASQMQIKSLKDVGCGHLPWALISRLCVVLGCSVLGKFNKGVCDVSELETWFF